MLFWILAALVIYYVGLFLPATAATLKMGVLYNAGPRDGPLTPDVQENVFYGRANRAHKNFCENLAPFLALAVLAIVSGAGPAAMTGAAVFVIARLVYIPVYLAGVPFVRTLVFLASLVGMIMMAVAVTSAFASP